MLFYIIKVANFNIRTVLSSQLDNNEKMSYIKERMMKIETQLKEVREEMDASLKERIKVLYSQLKKYIKSQEFSTKFCTWEGRDTPPNKDKWAATKKSCMQAIECRFKESLIEWEDKNRFCAEGHRQLVEEFLTRSVLLCI